MLNNSLKTISHQYKTAHNMGFSAMLADEYILIVPFAYRLQFDIDELSRATEYNINCINFTQLPFRAEESRNISTAESSGCWLLC